MRFIRSFDLTLGTCIRAFSIVALIAAIVFYVQFQARNILLGPTITLSDNYQIVHHERTTTLVGTAKNIVKLTLNGREIHTTEHGEFSQTIVLENGYTIVELDAQDRFGRKTTLVREYVFVPLPV